MWTRNSDHKMLGPGHLRVCSPNIKYKLLISVYLESRIIHINLGLSQ